MNPQARVSPWLSTLLRPVHSLFMPSYFNITLHNTERIPKNGPVILAPIHRSRWDAFMLFCMTKRLPRFMASKDEFVGLQGWFMARLGAFPVNAQRPSSSTLKYCQQLLREGEALVVYPEGNLYYSPPGEVHPLKPGVAWIALQCQKELPVDLPIIPIRAVYGDRVLRFRSKVDMYVQPPLTVQKYAQLPAKEGVRELTADLQKALGDILNETRPPQSVVASAVD